MVRSRAELKKKKKKEEEEEVKAKKKGSSSSQNCEFFKIYLSKFSSHRLNIPKVAIKYLNGITKRNVVVLKDHTGRKWTCLIESDQERVAIKDGWQLFAHQRSLQNGDFLTFRYDGESSFDVKVYSANGALKKGTEIDTIRPTEDMETEQEEEEEEEEDEEYEPEQISEDSYNASRKYSGSALSQTTQATPKRKPPVRIIEKQRASPSSACSTVLENAHFWVDITPATEHALNVSKKVTNLFGIKLKQIVMLCDEEGKKWPMHVASRLDGRTAFTRGWALFYRGKNLKRHDRCLFKFVVGPGNISGEVKVQILRSGID